MPENKLEPSEHLDLLKLVKIVTGAEAAFIEAGTALAAIRDRKLYREETKTFEEFCQKHWGYNRAHAYRLICSVETVKMSPIGDKIKTESQARALKDVPSDRHVEVMAAASKSGEVTAKAITKAAQEVDKPRVTAGPPVIKDELGITVTAKAMPIWSRRDEVLAMMKDLSRIKCAIEQAQEAGDLLFIEVCNSTLADLSRCREGVSYALPYTVCPQCNGQLAEMCGLCKGRGVISKHLYQTVPAEIRSMREKRHGGRAIIEDAGQSSDVL